MLNIFNRNIQSEYQEKIIQAFPKRLKNDVIEVIKIIPRKSKLSFDLMTSDLYFSKIDNETIKISGRIYFDEPKQKSENKLTDTQKDILNCIYTRHYDGYIREKRLKKISDVSKKWTTPYIVQLIGEYIYELLPVIDKKINEETLDFYAEFRDKNPLYWQQTESRMISYWNEYYRSKFPKLKEYLGFKIVDRIKKRTYNTM